MFKRLVNAYYDLVMDDKKYDRIISMAEITIGWIIVFVVIAVVVVTLENWL